jgi:hypothetical protein
VTDGSHHYPFRYQGGHAPIDRGSKMTLEGRLGIETTQKGPDLCATCVIVVLVTTSAYGIADIPGRYYRVFNC